MRKSLLFAAVATLAASSCAEPPKLTRARAEMSQRERDSILGASRLPGAGVVRKGISMSDAQAKRAAMLDSLSGSN